jgi:hypothetical protein
MLRIMNRFPKLLIISSAVLLIFYAAQLQTIPNGADHYYMVDVGEVQVVLNQWGTLHATGYPHYVIIGNLLTALLRVFGATPATAAAMVSMFASVSALMLALCLALNLSRTTTIIPVLVTFGYGLTRTVWIHSVIPEIYSFGLVILVGLLVIGLWKSQIGGVMASRYTRVYALALLGGIGVAHHRAIIMVAPALLYAVWPILTKDLRKLPRVLGMTLALGLVGFLPYIYLPLRARSGSHWVYGEPGTFAGFWAEFNGAEAAQYVGLPATFADFWNNVTLINHVLLLDLTLPGILLGLIGLVWGVMQWQTRRAAITLLLSGGVAYGFHVLYYTDVLSALILPVTLSLVFGWLFLFDGLARAMTVPRAVEGVAALTLLGFAYFTVPQNWQFIHTMTTDPRGLETIAAAKALPPGSTLMLPWGPRHTAVGYGLDVTGELTDITLLDNKADYSAAFADGKLVVPEYLQYTYPLAWWEETLGAAVHVQAIAPRMVALLPEPETAENIPLYIDIVASQERVICADDHIRLDVAWLAPASTRDARSVFVHLLDSDGALLAQDDQFAPVYGWRPLDTWQPGEIIHDVYTLPNDPAAHKIRYGMYHQDDDGVLVNDFEREVTVDCSPP